MSKVTTLKIKKTNFVSIEILRAMYKNGLVQSFNVKDFFFIIKLRYVYLFSVLNNLKIISKPSIKKYLKYSDLVKLKDNKNLYFFSTAKGILTLSECKKVGLGGTLLFIC